MNGVNNQHTSTFTTTWATRDVLYPLVCCCLAAAQVTGLVYIIASVKTDYPIIIVVLVAGIVALEGITTSRWLNATQRAFYKRATYRIAELTVLALFVRLVTWFAFGTVSDVRELTNVLPDASAYFTADFLATLVVVALAWGRATGLDGLLTRLVVDTGEANLYRKYRSQNERDQHLPRRAQSRSSLARELTASWIWGGVFLAVCAGITSLELSGLNDTINPLSLAQLGLAPTMTLALFVYFGAGLWLTSCARHAAMNEWWLISDATKDTNVDRSWTRGTFATLGVIALLVTALPTGAGIPLLSWLKALAAGIATLFNAVVALLLSLISALLDTAPPESFDPPLPDDVANSPLLPQSLPATTESVNFDLEPAGWGVLIVVLVLVSLYFLRGRFKLPWAFLRKIWMVIWTWLVDGSREAVEHTGEAEVSPEHKTRFRGLETLERILGRSKRFDDGSVRAKIVGVYVEFVQRASKAGVDRAPGQTPFEYEPLLNDRWPDARDAIGALTSSFIKARYSLTDITTDELDAARQSLKKFLATATESR